MKIACNFSSSRGRFSLRFLERARNEPLCHGLRTELLHLLRARQDLSGENQRVESRGGRDWLEDLVDVLVGQGILSASSPRVVVQLPLLQIASFVLELLDRHGLVFVKLDRLLVHVVHSVHEVLKLSLEYVRSAEVQELAARFRRDLLGELEEYLVHQVRVLYDDGDLAEEAVIGHLQVLDLFWRKIVCLVELNCGLGQTVGLQA